jgi:biopolymer transport protein ExbB
MEMKMTFMKKLTAAAIGSAVFLSAAPIATAQVTSVQDVLNKIRQDAAKTEAENREREQRFRSRQGEQESLLREARSELSRLEGQARRVQSTFDGNDARISRLSEELKAAQGDFGEVFGLARSKAGEFKALLDNSLITAQYPTRTQVLGRVSESKALPNTDELNAIWKTMLDEIVAQRQVATFPAAVANIDDGAELSVTRVGPFAAFTSNGAEFLGYKAVSESNPISLSKLPKQPGGAINAAAANVNSAAEGSLVYAPIDPTRGGLLASFERVPDTRERIAQGGKIGYIIVALAALGSLFGLLNIIRLFLTSMAVNGQKRKAQAAKGNPLGRVMMAYDDAKNKDADTVELKLDEAILRESPKLEFGLNFLKLGAGIAPLLGLLGTVTGMIKTFQAMMIYGTGDPQLMAGGISEALVTTMLGLIAAIPLLILHSFCASLARNVQNTLEEQSAGIVARHVESQN